MSTRDEVLEEVLPNYRAWLYRVAMGMVDQPDVEDVAQEGYIAMWRALPKHDPAQGYLPAYLTTVARRRMVEVVVRGTWTGKAEMRGSRPVDVAAHIGDWDDPDVLLGGVDALDGVEIAYHHGEIADALDTLSPAQRRYVVARFWLGLDPTSREPGMRALCALVPEIQGARGRALWHGSSKQRGARERLAEALAHLGPEGVAA